MRTELYSKRERERKCEKEKRVDDNRVTKEKGGLEKHAQCVDQIEWGALLGWGGEGGVGEWQDYSVLAEMH